MDHDRDAALIAGLVADLAPVRRVPPIRTSISIVVGIWLAGSIALAVFKPQLADVGGRVFAEWSYGLLTVALLVAGVAGVLAAVSASLPGIDDMERAARRLGAAALGTALLLGGIAALAESGASLAPAIADSACFGLVLGVGLLPGVPLLLVLRRGFVLRPLRAAAIALLGAFGLGGLTVQLVCPLVGSAHAFFGHVMPTAVVMIAAAMPLALLLRASEQADCETGAP